MTDPLVSVITPTFNRIKYLEVCLQSVLNQSYPNIEHILVDGASTDGTVELLASYQAKYPDRIRFISEPDEDANEVINKGFKMMQGEIVGRLGSENANKAINKGFKMMQGVIVGCLGSDDTYEPDAIQAVVDFFTANPDAYFVFGDCNGINEKGEVIDRFGTRDFNLKEEINDRNCVPWTAAFCKRQVIDKVGGYDTNLRSGGDVDYFIRVGKVFPIYRMRKVLSNFRGHQNKCLSWMSGKMMERDAYIISRRHGGSLLSPCFRRYFAYVLYDWCRPVIGLLRPVLGFAYPFLWRLLYGRN